MTLHSRLGARLDEVEEITAELGAQFIVACLLLRSHVDLADLADAAVCNPAIQALLLRPR